VILLILHLIQSPSSHSTLCRAAPFLLSPSRVCVCVCVSVSVFTLTIFKWCVTRRFSSSAAAIMPTATTTTTTTEESQVPPVLPRCQILLRSKEGVEVYDVPERNVDVSNATTTTQRTTSPRSFLIKGLTTSPLQVAPNGSAVYAHLTNVGIVKCSIISSSSAAAAAVDQHQKQTTTTPFFAQTLGVQIMDLSPRGTFLLTWERWYQDKCPFNLKLWETKSGKLVGAFAQKALRREAWPYLQWNHDETVAALQVTNEVRFYTPAAFASSAVDRNSSSDADTAAAAAAAAAASTVRFTDKIRITGISSMSMPRQSAPSGSASATNNNGVLFTAFCPGTKDKPARASLYEYRPDVKVKPDEAPILSKSLFQAEEMKVHWSPHGDAALITLQTAVDSSGQSYYGSSQLFLLRKPSANAKSDDGMIAVPLPQEGPVLDVQWMPDATKPPCFAVIAGKMPAMASLHHGVTGKATFLFGNNVHRNTISFARHGRFVCLAGFGNLAGGMSFWDRNKLKLTAGDLNMTGHVKAEAVVGFGWMPDSRIFYCSTCTPRMNVDNGVRLFRYNGEEIRPESLPWDNARYYRPDKLLEACIVPAPTLQTYPDRPQSPLPLSQSSEGVAPATIVASATPVAPTTAAPVAAKPAGRYVPPSQRNKVSGGGVVGAGGVGGHGAGGSSLAERMRREKEGNVQTAVRVADKPNVVKDPQGRVVVGMAPPAPTGKSKSAVKREKLKQKKQQQPAPPQAEAVAKEAAAATGDVDASTQKSVRANLKRF
jgi:translation initiation factor 2A